MSWLLMICGAITCNGPHAHTAMTMTTQAQCMGALTQAQQWGVIHGACIDPSGRTRFRLRFDASRSKLITEEVE